MRFLVRHWVAVLVVAALCAGVAWIAISVRRNAARRLDLDRLGAARQLWNKNGPRSYVLRYTISRGGNPQADDYEVHVAAGRVAYARVNKIVEKSERFHNYGMEKLFDYVETFLNMDAKKAAGQRAMHWADFDPDHGGLTHYSRHVPGTTESVAIEVLGLTERAPD